MLSIRLTRAAQQDMDGIGRYTFLQWGKAQRNLYLTQLDAALTSLAKWPEMGKPLDDFTADVRGFICQKHVICYRIRNNQIQILRILNHQQDISAGLHDL